MKRLPLRPDDEENEQSIVKYSLFIGLVAFLLTAVLAVLREEIEGFFAGVRAAIVFFTKS